jgi:hypothetical protein
MDQERTCKALRVCVNKRVNAHQERVQIVATLKDRIVTLLGSTPGLTDRELTDHLFGPVTGQQATNQASRALAAAQRIVRRKRQDGKFGNYLTKIESVTSERSGVPGRSQPETGSECRALTLGATTIAEAGDQVREPKTIQESICAYYDEAARGPHHRYRSWEHCYGFFRQNQRTGIAGQKEYAALHLGFYLASWGMYRGSTFLHKHTYTIHLGVIDTLIAPRFSVLWEQEIGAGENDLDRIPLIIEAIDGVREAYRPFAPSSESRQASDTLVTKVILGTFGCLPACDRFFIEGFKRTGHRYSRLNTKFIERILLFCKDNLSELREGQARIERIGKMRYPLMKLVDMYFWQVGFELELRAVNVSATLPSPS